MCHHMWVLPFKHTNRHEEQVWKSRGFEAIHCISENICLVFLYNISHVSLLHLLLTVPFFSVHGHSLRKSPISEVDGDDGDSSMVMVMIILMMMMMVMYSGDGCNDNGNGASGGDA